jgi:hypothetical protein
MINTVGSSRGVVEQDDVISASRVFQLIGEISVDVISVTA